MTTTVTAALPISNGRMLSLARAVALQAAVVRTVDWSEPDAVVVTTSSIRDTEAVARAFALDDDLGPVCEGDWTVRELAAGHPARTVTVRVRTVDGGAA